MAAEEGKSDVTVVDGDDDLRLGSKIVRFPEDCDIESDWDLNELLSSQGIIIDTSRELRVIALLGFPFDEGCVRNGGRQGASQGPSVFRKHVMKTGTIPNPLNGCHFRNVVILDCGDIDSCLDYDRAHSALRRCVSSLLSRPQIIPFVVGGSNDQSYFNARALLDHLFAESERMSDTLSKSCVESSKSKAKRSPSVGVINIDAHLDVRPQKSGFEHSGSPFRLLLEDDQFLNGEGSAFVEFAAQSHQCSMKHVSWINERPVKSRILWFDKLRKGLSTISDEFEKLFQSDQIFAESKSLFVSFDIDSIRQSDCPGVSCPSPIGLTSDDAIEISFHSGLQKKVRLMDVSEFNPRVDSYGTGKLMALIFYSFVMGVSMRK